jgi:hypothetical protein
MRLRLRPQVCVDFKPFVQQVQWRGLASVWADSPCRCIAAGGDPQAADIEERDLRFLFAESAYFEALASDLKLVDYSKQPSFEVGVLGFYVATGVHPYGDGDPSGLPTPYDAASYPAMPPSWPPSFRELLVQCVSIDAVARPGIVEVASRLRELRSAAWLSVEEALSLTRQQVLLFVCCVLCSISGCLYQQHSNAPLCMCAGTKREHG